MENLKLVAIPELIDLLARETALYSKMLTTDGDFEKCRERIKELQKEIVARRATKDLASSSQT